MKRFHLLLPLALAAACLTLHAADSPANEDTPPPAAPEVQPVDAPPPAPPEEAEPTDAGPPPSPAEVAPRESDGDAASPTSRERTPDRSAPDVRPSDRARGPGIRTPPAASESNPGTRDLRLNFRGVPLDMVLDYLSDAAGFIINLETEVRGKVDVWSNQPLTRDEAVALLNTVLHKNGYAAIRNDRTLTIVSRDDAKKRDVPVISGSDPEAIPRNDEVVTQIIPVRYINAVQLTKDLQPLMSATATLAANEGGNAIVVSDTQANIRRLAEIVQALDTAIASVSTVRVFPLRYADAKTLATMVRDLFTTQDTSRANNQGGPGRFFNQIRGGPGGGNATDASASGGRAPTPKVVAVADERSNSLVVSAPEEQMLVIAAVVEEIDSSVEDITELRVFRLKHADPQETADLLASLFPDSSRDQTGTGQVRFRGPFAQGRANGAAETSARMQKQTRVTAVPDLRTRSVVVSASRDLMEQIGRMVEQLDADPARQQKVFVYSVENSDPQAIQEAIETLFPEQNSANRRTTRNTQRQNSNQLNTRQTQNQNQQNRVNTGFGNQNNAFGNTGNR